MLVIRQMLSRFWDIHFAQPKWDLIKSRSSYRAFGLVYAIICINSKGMFLDYNWTIQLGYSAYVRNITSISNLSHNKFFFRFKNMWSLLFLAKWRITSMWRFVTGSYQYWLRLEVSFRLDPVSEVLHMLRPNYL